MLRDDPNESSAVYLLSSDDNNKFLAKSTSLPEIFSDVSSHLWRRLSITCRATKRMVCRYRTNLGDFRHRRMLGIYKRTWKRAKTAKRNSTKCKWIFHQLAAKNFNVNVVQRSTASVIRYSIGKKKKSYIIHLFDRPKSGIVRAKKYLAGHHDRRPAVRYFEPWYCMQSTPSSRMACWFFFWTMLRMLFAFSPPKSLVLGNWSIYGNNIIIPTTAAE